MKTVTLFYLISLLALAPAQAATINFASITATNTAKTNDLLLLDSTLAVGHATRTITVANLASTALTNYVTQSALTTATNSAVSQATNAANAYADSLTNGIIATATNNAKSYVDPLLALKAALASPALTGTPTINGTNILIYPTQLSLTHAGTVTLDLSAVRTECDFTGCTGAVTFATANLGAGRQYLMFGRNTNSVNVTPTFPAWQWQGGSPPFISAQKNFLLSLYSRGTVDTNVWAAYTESQ